MIANENIKCLHCPKIVGGLGCGILLCDDCQKKQFVAPVRLAPKRGGFSNWSLLPCTDVGCFFAHSKGNRGGVVVVHVYNPVSALNLWRVDVDINNYLHFCFGGYKSSIEAMDNCLLDLQKIMRSLPKKR